MNTDTEATPSAASAEPAPSRGVRVTATEDTPVAWTVAVSVDAARVRKAFDRAYRAFGGVGGSASGRRRFEVRTEIPIGRGLGSSAAAIVAGLLLGAGLAPGAATREGLLALGAIHFTNLYLFHRIRRRGQIRLAPPPVKPQLNQQQFTSMPGDPAAAHVHV